MTRDEKFQIGMALNKIALSLSDEDFHKVKDYLKQIENIVAEQTEPSSSEKPNNCEDEPQTDIHDLTDCDFCKHRNCKDCEGGKDEPQTYITEDRDTQILDAWQVHHRSTTSVEDEPQTMYYPQVDGITPSVISTERKECE